MLAIFMFSLQEMFNLFWEKDYLNFFFFFLLFLELNLLLLRFKLALNKVKHISKKMLTCKNRLWSKLYALGRPSKVEKATFPPVRGEISLNSSVHKAVFSSSPGRIKPLASFP